MPTGSFTCGYHGLAVLHAFRRPRSVAEALAAFAPRLVSPQDWIDLTSTIWRLYQGGALLGDTAPPAADGDTPYDHAISAIDSLERPALVEPIIAALRGAIRPGMLVVDLAGSTGLLAIAAAKAGAGRVFVRPAFGAAELVRAGIAANEVGDRVKILDNGAPLPKADLLISERILTSPFDRDLLIELRAAALQALAPGGRTLPLGLRRLAIPVAVPREARARQTFTASTVADWRAWYGIEFGPCTEVAGRTPRLFVAAQNQLKGWPILGEAVLLSDEWASHELPAAAEATETISATATGELGGLLLVSELVLDAQRRLSSNPASVQALGIGAEVWLLPQPLAVEPGDSLRVAYREPAATAAFWVRVTPEQRTQ
jgi:hypothetical protein